MQVCGEGSSIGGAGDASIGEGQPGPSNHLVNKLHVGVPLRRRLTLEIKNGLGHGNGEDLDQLLLTL